MFLRKRGTTWSGDLLRDELLQAGIRHTRTRLPSAPAQEDVCSPTSLDEWPAPVPVKASGPAVHAGY